MNNAPNAALPQLQQGDSQEGLPLQIDLLMISSSSAEMLPCSYQILEYCSDQEQPY
jgi:hypothetical protein